MSSIKHRSAGLDLVKWLAMVTMVADHSRFVWPSAEWLFVVGRLAFPLFCLAIAANVARSGAGQVFSAANGRYLGWMLVFSVLSQWPYQVLDVGTRTFNIMPTLTLGLLMAWGFHYPARGMRLLALGTLLVSLLASDVLMYGWPGVVLPSAFLLALRGGRGTWLVPGFVAVMANLSNDWLRANLAEPITLMTMAAAGLSAPLGMRMLRGQYSMHVWRVGRWGYWFYPLHLLLIIWVTR
ncbi:conjugal transfer protein TraX [Pseudomonas sp. GD03860]|uniref:TraX family protein n=1 Tax=Pseudomonas TaxID=286 RepID=UPI002363635F|nr:MULTISPECIES: TraX family protein [Pseudomonas]MDD2058933.1 conjugal transfer protein TraX [Pseudomonas putida]MDH0639873.1 conjugal transfer protein TraX [Pseudomonas sp. GD03860]